MMSWERITEDQSGIHILTFGILEKYGVKHGIIVKCHGRDIDKDHAYQTLSCQKPLVITHQVHGETVRLIDGSFSAFHPGKVEADGLMTATPGIRLSIHTADCVPVMLASKDGRAVALIHAGWKGTSMQITSQGLKKFLDHFKLEPGQAVAAIGPCIEKKCYEVGQEVAVHFTSHVKKKKLNGKWLLDLRTANARQLLAGGISKEDIHVSELCTKCRPDIFHSYRHEKELKGQMISFMEAGQ